MKKYCANPQMQYSVINTKNTVFLMTNIYLHKVQRTEEGVIGRFVCHCVVTT